MRKRKNKVFSFKIKRWKERLRGRIIAESENWILIESIPVDYAVDGYKFLNKKFINSTNRGAFEEQIELVLKLKNVKRTLFRIENLQTELDVMEWVEKKFELFEFQDNEQNALFIGKKNRIEKDKYLVINAITTEGIVDYDFDVKFKIKKIRVISFESDYFQSIRLLWKYNNQ